jgi:hypothetical protein
VTSGYAKVRESDLPPGSLFVEKPYTPEQISDKMTALMAA